MFFIEQLKYYYKVKVKEETVTLYQITKPKHRGKPKQLSDERIKSIIAKINSNDPDVRVLSYNGNRYYNYMVDDIHVNQQRNYISSSESIQHKQVLTIETADIYKRQVEPYIVTAQWVQNIIDGTDHGEIIYKETNNYFLMPDFKWDLGISNLHLLVLFKDERLRSLRDLAGNDVNLLKLIKREVLEYVDVNYKVDQNQLRLYVHYHPSVWRLHIHVQHLQADCIVGIKVERAHLLDTIIYNLSIKDDYYQSAELTCLGYDECI